MNKTLLTGMITAAITVTGFFGYTPETIARVPAHSDHSITHVTRDGLLSTESLTEVDGATLKVADTQSVKALKAEIENAKDGATITIAAGKYENLGEVIVKANNVTIKPQVAGTVWLTGLTQLRLEGDGIIIDSLVFTEGGPAERFGGVRMMGNNNTLQNSTFYYFNHDYIYKPDERRQEYPRYLWVSLWGKEGKLINNRFEGKQKRGTLIGVQKDETPDNHLIANNLFLDQQSNQFNELDIKKAVRYNGNSWEAIRIGDSTSSQWPSRSKIINNLMINMDGERELISIKSGENVISGNTIFESASLISLRHGKANTVSNNVILGNGKRLTGGIRIYDEDHIIQNNYITGTRGREGLIEGNADLRGGIVINTGIIDVAHGEVLDNAVKGKELNKQWTPKNVTINNNTLIDTEWGIVYGNQTHRVSLFDNSVVENTFTGANIHFSHNIVDNSAHPEFVSVRATTDHPLINPAYSNETYIGTVTEMNQIGQFSTSLPEKMRQGQFNRYGNTGADTSQLSLITAQTTGPDYLLVNAQKLK